MDSFLLLEISISTSFVKQIVIILRPHATTVATIADSIDIFMKKNDVIDEIKNARLLKALYLPKTFSLSSELHDLYRNAISHPEVPDTPIAVNIVWNKNPIKVLQNNKLNLAKKNTT